MINNEEQHEHIKRLEAEVRMLREEDREQRDRLTRRLVSSGLWLIITILFLIGMAIWMRFNLEYVRLKREQDIPVSAPPTITRDTVPTPAPKQPDTAGPATAQPSDPKRKLDDYVDRATGKGNGGNSYSVTLGGLGELVNGMVKTGQIAADKGTALMQELGKSVISTTGDILKESAKAIIARYLGPESEKEAKATAGGPTQQVLVNVYGSEKQVVASQPKKTTRPAKPKPSCPVPAPVPDTKPPSCSPS
jgi:polyhydroxyalkanoate synthesis regulator phasin